MAEPTIAAIATPLGEGGIGVIRVSGADAISIADRCFRAYSGQPLSALKGYQAAYGQVIDGDLVLDDAVALVFHAPKSFTGENTVEISVHGGRMMVQSVLRQVFACGAAPAAAGEFTKRAFLNGKIDLADAESIMGLISAKNEAALRISRAAHGGRIRRETDRIVSLLLQTAASLAAYADYPDEEIPELSPENFGNLLQTVCDSCQKMLSTYDAGRLIREGIRCAIVGKPNVGKSTLMNLLCGQDRSIVTDIAGTTRDVVEETVTVGDVTLVLADTAGIHETDEPVERLGVDLALRRAQNADLILAVFDGSKPLDEDDLRLIERVREQQTLFLWNKSDLASLPVPSVLDGCPVLSLSAQTGNGAEALAEKIAQTVHTAGLDPDAAVLISERQRACVQTALDSAGQALAGLQAGLTLDAVGVCVDDALAALLALTGQRVTNEVTDEVFRRFCVGK
ncbi:MAG: tRNA uridine-5-carboxymethylaminomethyl(34) synthesis GTPase MnmE [Clostridia bacterium]|nr:tRNA uridine-5-carboxymethylaminomethyl(34) synthesis GTPase MnmE [Clostridia bacterium]